MNRQPTLLRAKPAFSMGLKPGEVHIWQAHYKNKSSAAILRDILSRYLNQSPNAIQILKHKKGKPYLPSGQLQFNVSHSKDQMLVAIADVAVGIDVEYIQPKRRIDQLVARFFSEEEILSYQSLPTQSRLLAFYRAWTRKEAYVKGTGQGLTHSLSSFTVSFEPDAIQEIQGWTIFSFEIDERYLSSLALKAPVHKLMVFEWVSLPNA